MSADRVKTIAEQVWELARREAPWLEYGGVYRYRVRGVSGGRLDLDPVKESRLPQLSRVVQWPGLGGGETTPRIGAECALAFLDADPLMPVVLAWLPARAGGGVPAAVSLDADAIDLGAAAGSVVRLGEAVVVDPITGIITRKPALSQPPAFADPSKVKA